MPSPGPIGETSPNTIRSRIKTITKATSAALTAAEVSGTKIDNYGQKEDVDLALPPGVDGYSFAFDAATTVAKHVRFDPCGSEHIWLNGEDQGAGKYVQFDPVAEGNRVAFHCIKGSDGNLKWRADVITGAMTAEL
jgi:hypothetical protein